MKLKCVISGCPWLTVDTTYEAHHTGLLQWIFDDEGEEWFVCENTNGQYQIAGIDDAVFEEVSE